MLRKIPILLIRCYQLGLSSWLPASCRFTPTCSHYAIDAFSKYGIIKGFF